MTHELTLYLDAHEGINEKHREADCPFDLLNQGLGPEEILDATMYSEGSNISTEGNFFIYRRCGKTLCAAECALVITPKKHTLLDSARFSAPCTGKD